MTDSIIKYDEMVQTALIGVVRDILIDTSKNGLPLIVDDEWIDKVNQTMPELPHEKLLRFMKEYELPDSDAKILTSSIELANFFEKTAAPLNDKKQAANWVMTTLLGMLNSKKIGINESPVSADSFSRLLSLIETRTINTNAAKTVFEEMVSSSKDPETIVREKGLEQLSDKAELAIMVDKIISDNPKEAAAYKSGKTKLFSFFMGQVMKTTRGKADPKIITQLLKGKL